MVFLLRLLRFVTGFWIDAVLRLVVGLRNGFFTKVTKVCDGVLD